MPLPERQNDRSETYSEPNEENVASYNRQIIENNIILPLSQYFDQVHTAEELIDLSSTLSFFMTSRWWIYWNIAFKVWPYLLQDETLKQMFVYLKNITQYSPQEQQLIRDEMSTYIEAISPESQNAQNMPQAQNNDNGLDGSPEKSHTEDQNTINKALKFQRFSADATKDLGFNLGLCIGGGSYFASYMFLFLTITFSFTPIGIALLALTGLSLAAVPYICGIIGRGIAYWQYTRDWNQQKEDNLKKPENKKVWDLNLPQAKRQTEKQQRQTIVVAPKDPQINEIVDHSLIKTSLNFFAEQNKTKQSMTPIVPSQNVFLLTTPSNTL